MSEKLRTTVVAVAGLALALAAVPEARAQAAPAAPPAQQATGGAAAPKTAEQAYKNIQVLKGTPADQVIPAMQFIANSLGVECEYCHVQRAFDKDDKVPKQTARKMIQMMMAINKDNFKGRVVVTCFSCHRGAKDPVAIPIIAETGLAPEPGPAAAGAAPSTSAAAGPTPSQLVDKYVEALGGADVIQKVTSRVVQGTLSGFGGHEFPVDVFAKAPDKRMSVMHLPNGDSVTAFDGQVGWMGIPGQPPREMTGAELDAVRLDSDFYFPLRVKEIFPQLRPGRPEKVGDHEAYVVMGIKPGQPPVKLYFDQQSGLLVRLVRYAETPLGRNPTEVDYADYRDVDGVKVPFRWTIARPLGRFTIQAQRLQQNVPIDDAKFSKPPAPPEPAAAGQKPSSP